MKVISTESITKLIQLIKDSFIHKDNSEIVNEVTLAEVAISGNYNDLNNKLIAGENIILENNVISAKSGSMPIGTIIPVNANENYVPDGCLPCDGAEYGKAQFSDLWNNFLTGEEKTVVDEVVVYQGSNVATIFNIPRNSSNELYGEFVLHFTTGSNVANGQYLIELNSSGANSVYRLIIMNANLYNSKDLNTALVTGITANTDYQFIIRNNSTTSGTYDIYLKQDEETLVLSAVELDLSEYSFYSDIRTYGGTLNLAQSYYKDANGNVKYLEKTVIDSLLNTCTYTEYETEIATYGQCAKFAVDVDNEKFRVPLIKDTETVVTNNIDYANKLALESTPIEATPFVAPYDGVLIFTVNQNINDYRYCYINGVLSPHQYFDGDATAVPQTYHIPLSKGDSIYWTSAIILKDGGFYPYKEETKEKLKSFVVVANGQTNQSMMDWSAWASSLQGKANIDGSNWNSSVKNVDSAFVTKVLTLSTSTAIGTYEIDLADYLPNDGYIYEIYLRAYALRSGSSLAMCYLSTSIQPTDTDVRANFFCSSGNESTSRGCWGTIFVGSDRKLTQINTSYAFTTLILMMTGYRRIGTNV